MKYLFINFFLFAVLITSAQQNEQRWKLNADGAITWNVKPNDAHSDHIEMSGKFVSAFLEYGVDKSQAFQLNRRLVWPMLRTIPNNTHASLIRSFGINPVSMLTINSRAAGAEKVNEVILDGKITIKSKIGDNINLFRTLYPSTGLPVYCEKYELINTGKNTAVIEIPDIHIVSKTNASNGVDGAYSLTVQSQQSGTYTVKPSTSIVFYLTFFGEKKQGEIAAFNTEDELKKRNELLKQFRNNLILETPDAVLNKAFAFAKIRGAESIFQTKGGPMHGPGGLSFYAAIWANDQAEYINPFFPYLGYDYGIESALNSYRHFARFMNKEYKPIPSSIIAEGIDIWNGAGDRGDAAMIAYGAARFCLSQGNMSIAEELWPLIEWCLEYNHRKLNVQGVVTSDSDELEGRFPSGKANLCTSSLYYDALVSAQYLGKALGKKENQLSKYKKQSAALRKSMEQYFGANVMGHDTYRYYEGNDKLRAWICIPLTVNIFDRKKGTIEALFSPELWTEDGLATESGDKTFWDRATLYALRGVFAAGETEKALKYLQYYSTRRLLGEHVPYAVEAYPEGNQRHLSAESGLYCRIYTEGLFGIRPVGLHSFTITPQLPAGWNNMALRKVHGYGKEFDVQVKRKGDKLELTVKDDSKVYFNMHVKNGSTSTVML